MRRLRTLLFLAIALPMANTTAAPADTSPVVATVNGTPITRSLFEAYQRERDQKRPGDANALNPKVVLDEIVNLELWAQDGVKQGLDKNPEVQAQIEQQRRAVIANATLQKYLVDHPVTEAEIRAFYKDKAANLGSEYKARDILVADEDKAKELIAELDTGANFSELAKKNSADASAPNGGELGWRSAQQMAKPVADAVAKLEKGKYTTKPVQTRFGWYVIMLDDKRDIMPPPLNQVGKQILMDLQNQHIQNHVQQLRDQAKIDSNEANLPVTPEAQVEADREALKEAIHEDRQPE